MLAIVNLFLTLGRRWEDLCSGTSSSPHRPGGEDERGGGGATHPRTGGLPGNSGTFGWTTDIRQTFLSFQGNINYEDFVKMVLSQ